MQYVRSAVVDRATVEGLVPTIDIPVRRAQEATPPADGLNEFAVRTQCSAKGADLHSDAVFLNRLPAPNGLHQLRLPRQRSSTAAISC